MQATKVVSCSTDSIFALAGLSCFHPDRMNLFPVFIQIGEAVCPPAGWERIFDITLKAYVGKEIGVF
jgi:hypothetical protein